MNITPEIIEAFKEAGARAGNYAALAKELEVSTTTVYNWVNGVTAHISDCTWRSKLRPLLAPYLKEIEPDVEFRNEITLSRIDQQIRAAATAAQTLHATVTELKAIRKSIDAEAS